MSELRKPLPQQPEQAPASPVQLVKHPQKAEVLNLIPFHQKHHPEQEALTVVREELLVLHEISQSPEIEESHATTTDELNTATTDVQLPEINIGVKASLKFVFKESCEKLKKIGKQSGRSSGGEDTEEQPDERTKIENVRALVTMLQNVQGQADMIARRQAKHETAADGYISPFDKEFAEKDLAELRKSQSMIGLLQLVEIDKMPEEKRRSVMKQYHNLWGEVSTEYVEVFQGIKRSIAEEATANEDEGKTTREDAASILSDLNIPVERKIELLTKAGLTKKEAGKAVLFTAAAAVSTIGISTLAEGGAVASAAHATANPYLDGLQFPKDLETLTANLKAIGVDAAMFGGFYATTALYAKLHAIMTEKTGFGLNAFATGIHHIDKAIGVSQDEIKKDMMKTILIVNLALDAPYLATILIPEVGTSMMANAYKFGIQLTAVQAAVCASVIGGAKLVEVVKEKQNAKLGLAEKLLSKPVLVDVLNPSDNNPL